MQLDLTRLRKPLQRFDHTLTPAQVPQAGEVYRVVAPVAFGFDVHKDKAQFRLVGRVTTTLELDCGRCLDPFTLPVDAAFDVRYHPQAEVNAAGSEDADVEVAESDLDDAYYSDDQIDLDELMREQFYLVLPMKPLCREDCKGLCPECGTNLNTGTCACRREWIDPRLAPLKALVPDEPTS